MTFFNKKGAVEKKRKLKRICSRENVEKFKIPRTEKCETIGKPPLKYSNLNSSFSASSGSDTCDDYSLLVNIKNYKCNKGNLK